MKKSLIKMVLGLFIMTAVSLSFSPQAEAINVQLRNPYPHKLWAAIVYFEDSANKWVTRGWYGVEPKSTRNINLSSSTKKNSVYIHAHTSEASWGGSGESIKRTVIKEAFKYYDGQSCPPGNNRRQVSFDRWNMENNGVVYWKP